jgi:hypothetical protein
MGPFQCSRYIRAFFKVGSLAYHIFHFVDSCSTRKSGGRSSEVSDLKKTQ